MRLTDSELQQQEYEQRIKFFKTDYSGSFSCPVDINFHPNLFKGTQKEYDDICINYLFGKEDEFKIIGEHSFNTYEDYLKKYKNLH